MSSASPNWDDLHFDRAAADAAIGALRAAFDKLGIVAALRQSQADAARQWWSGTYRDVFDAEMAAAARAAAGLQEALATALRRIQQAGDAAVAEQHLREADRAQYFRDRAEVDRIRAEQLTQRLINNNL